MTTKHLLPFQRLDVYVAAKELARRVHDAKIRDAALVVAVAPARRSGESRTSARPVQCP